MTDIGVRTDSDPNDTELMFHRIGLRVGAMISEGEFERALVFCGTGMGIHIADAYLSHSLGDGYEWWPNFYEFHKLAMDELDAFDYDAYKKNGFRLEHLGDYPLADMDKPGLFPEERYYEDNTCGSGCNL